MTRYEHGFLTKCAERGVPRGTSAGLLKSALGLRSQINLASSGAGAGVGALAGALAGAFSTSDREKRRRRALYGTLLGLLGGAGVGYYRSSGAANAAGKFQETLNKQLGEEQRVGLGGTIMKTHGRGIEALVNDAVRKSLISPAEAEKAFNEMSGNVVKAVGDANKARISRKLKFKARSKRQDRLTGVPLEPPRGAGNVSITAGVPGPEKQVSRFFGWSDSANPIGRVSVPLRSSDLPSSEEPKAVHGPGDSKLNLVDWFNSAGDRKLDPSARSSQKTAK